MKNGVVTKKRVVLGCVACLSVLFLISVLIQNRDRIFSWLDSAPALTLGDAELKLDMQVGELLDQGFVLLDSGGEALDPAEWMLAGQSSDTENYALAVEHTGVHAATWISIYNPGRKTKPLRQCLVSSYRFDFSPYVERPLPIRVNGADYAGLSALDAMKTLSASGNLELNETRYRQEPSRCTFEQGPYRYTLYFYNSNTCLDRIAVSRSLVIQSGRRE